MGICLSWMGACTCSLMNCPAAKHQWLTKTQGQAKYKALSQVPSTSTKHKLTTTTDHYNASALTLACSCLFWLRFCPAPIWLDHPTKSPPDHCCSNDTKEHYEHSVIKHSTFTCLQRGHCCGTSLVSASFKHPNTKTERQLRFIKRREMKFKGVLIGRGATLYNSDRRRPEDQFS